MLISEAKPSHYATPTSMKNVYHTILVHCIVSLLMKCVTASNGDDIAVTILVHAHVNLTTESQLSGKCMNAL